MNGVHDMGGMHGFGAIPRGEGREPFHAEWEGRMFGMLLALGSHGVHDPGGLRAAHESMEPASYLGSGYFEGWLRVTERALLEKGYLTLAELDQRTAELDARPDAVAPRREEPTATARMMQAVHTRSPSSREGGRPPRFRSGDSVRVRNLHPPGHTRLPRYVRGKLGAIASLHGIHDFHDAAPEGAANAPQPVYSVRFEAEELWGEAAEARQSLYLDMWESYLEPAQS
jgi:nitrile hydratase beta subunit